ncbi:MFS transporter [Flexivirga oryzae]|uniref:MFS family permease n=1 Tax=Flexivirga oryzae TaxID=1794944 RepID=A0A839N928_9MICO|nr:MFS transporter [Flexivirga oryzae]MBB2892504.1 MFS family permease [Flexivirga oryzae]
MTSPGDAMCDELPTDAKRPALWRNRDFQLLVVGNTLNGIGSRMSGLAFPLLALWMTHSAALAGLVGGAVVAGLVVAGLPAGAFVDRWNRRQAMVWSALVAAAAYATVVVAYAADLLTIAHLVVAGVVVGAAESVFGPADTLATKAVVPAPDLSTAMSAVEGRQGVTGLIGPPLGGLLFSVSRSLPVLADVVSYVVSAAAALLVRTPLPAPRPEGGEHEPPLQAMRSGLKFVWRHEVLRPVVVVATLLNFAVNGFLLVLIVVLQERGVRPVGIGLAETAIAVATIVGALLSAIVLKKLAAGRALIVGTVLLGTCLVACAFVHSYPVLLVLLAVGFLLIPAVNAGFMTYVMLITPEAMQGRVQSALMTTLMAMSPLAPVVGGLFVEWWNGEVSLVVLGGLALLSALVVGLVGPLRRMPLLADVPPVDQGPQPDAAAA